MNEMVFQIEIKSQISINFSCFLIKDIYCPFISMDLIHFDNITDMLKNRTSSYARTYAQTIIHRIII